MTLDTIAQALKTLRHSSHFVAGDPGSFKVKFTPDYELPGKDEPADYLDRLGLKAISGKVCVVYPGNGGLCVEALKRGAVDVLAVEPRESFLKTLVEVSMFSSTLLGRTFSSVHGRGMGGAGAWSQTYDVVIWSEGLDRLKDPALSMKHTLGLVKPGGSLYIEVTHGQHGTPTVPVNSWLPKEEVFEKVLADIVGDAEVSKLKGRLDRRTVYRITTKAAPEPAPIEVQAVTVPQELADEFKADPEGAIRDAAGEPTADETPAEDKPKRVSMKRKGK